MTGKKDGGDNRGADGQSGPTEDGYSRWVLHNPRFEAYYQAMGIVPQAEWADFIHALQQPLPACFRIHLDCTFKDQAKENLLEYLKAPMVVEGREVKAVVPLPWYHGGLAYQLGCDRRFIRKHPGLTKFHAWLNQLMDSGNLTRQEAVSMLPPLFMDVRSDHLVLDMCAAPGSKTAQLMEMITQGETVAAPGHSAATNGPRAVRGGLVVANDADRDRAFLLAHQCKRVKSPAIAVTWCPAQNLPNLTRADGGGVDGESGGIFDRVLADVPCSGDGTLRKQPSIWRAWKSAGAIGLHPLQLIIALRGAALTRIGGKMVYSTCSLNPIEDEAVVAEVLRRCGGNLRLVDCSG
ncbi:unnamed protein product [Discosporangium mesarthrocarpum]